MINLYSIIYILFMILSIFAFLISLLTPRSVSLTFGLIGYLVLGFSIMMLLLNTFKNLIIERNNILQIIANSLPFILMIGVICFIIYIVVLYRSIIITGRVSDSYYTFNTMTTVLMIIQTIYIIYVNISNEQFKNKGIMPKIMSSLFYLFVLCATITSIKMFIPLKYFTTDG